MMVLTGTSPHEVPKTGDSTMAIETPGYASKHAALAALALAAPAMAADDGADQDASHRQPSTEIIVTAPYERDRETAAQAVTVLLAAVLALLLALFRLFVVWFRVVLPDIVP